MKLRGLVLASALLLRARLEAVARAEHELRGPATVLCMACERLRDDPAAQGHAEALEAELARLRAGLADLTAARAGRRPRTTPAPLELERLARSAMAGWGPELEREGRPARVRWRAGRPRVAADRGRLAQALGNLVANAASTAPGRWSCTAGELPSGCESRCETVAPRAPLRAWIAAVDSGSRRGRPIRQVDTSSSCGTPTRSW